jgi:hypothetical protein
LRGVETHSPKTFAIRTTSVLLQFAIR